MNRMKDLPDLRDGHTLGYFSRFQFIASSFFIFASPLVTFTYLYWGPYPWFVLPFWTIPFAIIALLDARNYPAQRQPPDELPRWLFDWMLYFLAFLQLANIFLLCSMTSRVGLSTGATWFSALLASGSSSLAGLVVAHELIHRRSSFERYLGRLVLCTLIYEHFYTEHLRSHHSRVATTSDPAMAHFGESFVHFWIRTIPDQFRSAWHLESQLGRKSKRSLIHRLQIKNKVLHGVAFEGVLMFGILVYFGPASLFIFVLQALGAITLVEAVNYLEHWGLQREGTSVTYRDAWDTDSYWSCFSLIGLARHSDHHVHAGRQFQNLQYIEQSPKLPMGYNAMIILILFKNKLYRELMTARLQEYGLGPFNPHRLGK